MSGVVAKMFIRSTTIHDEQVQGQSFNLGAVCRGETNKDWAAATPAGSATIADPVLAKVWAEKQAGERTVAEVLVIQRADPDGDWKMDRCDFSYGGCSIALRRQGQPYGQKIEMTVNASAATRVLREAYAAGLLEGKPPTFTVTIEDAGTDPL